MRLRLTWVRAQHEDILLSEKTTHLATDLAIAVGLRKKNKHAIRVVIVELLFADVRCVWPNGRSNQKLWHLASATTRWHPVCGTGGSPNGR